MTEQEFDALLRRAFIEITIEEADEILKNMNWIRIALIYPQRMGNKWDNTREAYPVGTPPLCEKPAMSQRSSPHAQLSLDIPVRAAYYFEVQSKEE